MDLIRFIFACFCIFANTIYLHHSLHIRFKIFAHICIQKFNFMQKIHVAANIHFRVNIHLGSSPTGKYLFQNIRLEANICKTWSDKKFASYSLIFASNRISPRTLHPLPYIFWHERFEGNCAKPAFSQVSGDLFMYKPCWTVSQER